METKHGAGNRFHLSLFSSFLVQSFFRRSDFCLGCLAAEFFQTLPHFRFMFLLDLSRAGRSTTRVVLPGNSVSIFMYTLYTTLLIALSRLSIRMEKGSADKHVDGERRRWRWC